MRLIAPPDTDLNALYLTLAPQLRRVLGRNLRAPDWVVEDACQAAWETYLRDGAPVDGAHLLGWLATTARREALVTMSRGERETSLEPVGEFLGTRGANEPARTAELREHLATVDRLPRRQQKLVWMRGLGFNYAEISAQSGASPRVIQRQLGSARRRLARFSSDDAA